VLLTHRNTDLVVLFTRSVVSVTLMLGDQLQTLAEVMCEVLVV